MCTEKEKTCLGMDLLSGTPNTGDRLVSQLAVDLPLLHTLSAGPIFGSADYFTGLGIFFDTYSNYNGEHSVSLGYRLTGDTLLHT